jgi:hypothetical protein
VAKQDFLGNVRAARNLFVHRRVPGDNPQLDPRSLEDRIARAAIWLTPKSVGGFHADDFRELGPDRQRELTEAVHDFLAVATQVPPTATPTADQLARASAAFGTLLAILEPYLPTHEEAIRTEGALGTVEFPEWVANWDFELGSDSVGGPAVWVTIFPDEQITPLKQLGRFLSELTAKIHRALSSAGIDRWPYIRMRTGAEYKSMV